MNGTVRIRNWEKWQSYRRDRGQPPWIKVHRLLMRDPDWVALSDAQRGQLVSMWLLAADHDGLIPASAELVQKLCFMDSTPDFGVFVAHGFIQDDANVAPKRRQCDHTEKRRVEKRRVEESKDLSLPESNDVSLVSKRIGHVLAHAEQQTTKAERRAEFARLIFTYWAARLKKDPKRTKWDDKRKTRLTARLKENQDDICELLCVVDGALKDDFHNSANGCKFLQIQTIFRDREMVEKLSVLSPHYGKDIHPFMVAL